MSGGQDIAASVAAMLLRIKGPTCCAIAAADPANRLWLDLHIDQIDRMSLALELEELFGLVIGDEALLLLVTVADIIAAVEAHVAAALDPFCAGDPLTPAGAAEGIRVAPPSAILSSPPCVAFAGGAASAVVREETRARIAAGCARFLNEEGEQ